MQRLAFKMKLFKGQETEYKKRHDEIWKELVQLLKENPSLKIQISGHTDNVGKTEDNLKLSDNRAQAVVKYLTSKGINPNRLSYKGYGASQPIAPNTTEEGRSQNRRTEVKVITS